MCYCVCVLLYVLLSICVIVCVFSWAQITFLNKHSFCSWLREVGAPGLALEQSDLPCAWSTFNLEKCPKCPPIGLHSVPLLSPIPSAEFRFSKPVSPWEIFFCGSGDVWVFRESVLTLLGVAPCGKTGAVIFLTGTIAEVKEEHGASWGTLGSGQSVPSEIRSRSLPSLVKFPYCCLCPLSPGNVPAHCFPLERLCVELRGSLQPSLISLLISLGPQAVHPISCPRICHMLRASVHTQFPLLGMPIPFCPPGKLLLIHQNPAQMHLPCLPLTHLQFPLSPSLFHKMCITDPPRARHHHVLGTQQ